jgi:lysozyme
MKRSIIKAMLQRQEGFKAELYKDTNNKWTIGYGRCLETNPLTEAEAEFLLDSDITRIWQLLTTKLIFFGGLSDSRQHVLISMTYNLGMNGLMGFKKMLAAAEAANFNAAANEMLDSTWAKQVGVRAKELAEMMRSGI